MTNPRRTLRSVLVLVALAGLFSAAAGAKEVALIVAKNSPTKGVTAAEMAKAFKTPPAKFADGREIIFVVKGPATSETKIMGVKLLGQTPDGLPAFVNGAKKTFIVVGSDEEVVKTVNSLPNAIGVVDLYSINGSVTVIKVDGKLPLEPGYLLHYN